MSPSEAPPLKPELEAHFVERAGGCLAKLRSADRSLGAAEQIAVDALEKALRCKLLDGHRAQARARRIQLAAELDAETGSAEDRKSRRFSLLLALQAEWYLDSVWACCEAMAMASSDAERDVVAYPALHGPLAKTFFEALQIPGDTDITQTVWRLIEAWPRRADLSILVPAVENLIQASSARVGAAA